MTACDSPSTAIAEQQDYQKPQCAWRAAGQKRPARRRINGELFRRMPKIEDAMARPPYPPQPPLSNRGVGRRPAPSRSRENIRSYPTINIGTTSILMEIGFNAASDDLYHPVDSDDRRTTPRSQMPPRVVKPAAWQQVWMSQPQPLTYSRCPNRTAPHRRTPIAINECGTCAQALFRER